MKNKSFAVLILTHGRPDRVYTYETLRKSGYTGNIYLVVDDLDKTVEKYKEKYADKVIVFDKKAISKTFDQGDNFNDMRAIIYARNASFEVAKKIGLEYFIQLDDDYTSFQIRFNRSFDYRPKTLKNLDHVFDSFVDFLKETSVDSLAMAQGGDFIGGEDSTMGGRIRLKRKCMNSFVCSTKKPFKFVGRINEDVNTYTHLASKGLLLFTTNQVNLNQMQTQTNAGGMTDLYLNSGTYVKSFYSIIFHPSGVKIGVLRGTSGAQRLHHNVNWKHTTPMILRESVKK